MRSSPTEPLPDEVLVARAHTGDEEALRDLAERWWPTMRRWAYLELGDRALAEDATQDALVRLVRFIGQVDPDRPFSTWIRAVVRNAARDVRSRRGRVEAHEGPELDLGYEAPVERSLDLRRIAALARRAFAALAPRQREILDLCDRQGLPPAEVARTLGLASGSVRTQLHAARRKLRTEILAADEVLALLREP